MKYDFNVQGTGLQTQNDIITVGKNKLLAKSQSHETQHETNAIIAEICCGGDKRQ
jgi:hypothetical protein